MSKAQPPPVKAVVIATDPTGAEVAFITSGWKAANDLRNTIGCYPNNSRGWSYVSTHRLISQREVWLRS